MSETKTQSAPVSEVVPHQPGCGITFANGRGRAACVCDDETHQLRIAYIRANGVRPSPAHRAGTTDNDDEGTGR